MGSPSRATEKKDMNITQEEDELFEKLTKLGPDAKARLLQKLGVHPKEEPKQEQPVKHEPEPTAGDLFSSSRMREYMTSASAGSNLMKSAGYDPYYQDSSVRSRLLPHDSNMPKLPQFSGLQDKDASFGRWRFEVRSMQKLYSEQHVLAAIHRSLKSPAADVIIHLEDSSLAEIMQKLDSLYGLVISGDTLMTKIYGEPQRPDEGCTQWATRLEDLCYLAADKGAVDRSSMNTMLASRFWSGLNNNDIKTALRTSKDTMTMEQLVTQARQLEEEFGKGDKKKAHTHQQQTTKESEITMLMKKMDDVLTAVCQTSCQKCTTSQEGNVHQQAHQARKTIVCHACKKEGHLAFGCRQGTDVTCYKCKKTGHIARACRNPLNS